MPFILDCTSHHAEMQPSVELPPSTTAPAANSWSVDVEPSDTDGTSDGSETTLVDGFLDEYVAFIPSVACGWCCRWRELTRGPWSSSEPPSPLDTPFSTDGSDFCHIGAQFDFEDTGNYASCIVEYPWVVPSVSDTESDLYPITGDDGDYDLSLSIGSSETLVV